MGSYSTNNTYTLYIGRAGNFWRYSQSICTKLATVNRGSSTYSSDTATTPANSSEILTLAAGEFPTGITFSGPWWCQQNVRVSICLADGDDSSNNYALGTITGDSGSSGNFSSLNKTTMNMPNLAGKKIALLKNTNITSGDGWGFNVGNSSTPIITIKLTTVKHPYVDIGETIKKSDMDNFRDYRAKVTGSAPTAVSQYDTAKAAQFNAYLSNMNVPVGGTIEAASFNNGGLPEA